MLNAADEDAAKSSQSLCRRTPPGQSADPLDPPRGTWRINGWTSLPLLASHE
jgi:hypothetical protein